MDELPPIPEMLDSAYREGPFTECSACGAGLERIWHVQKTWRGDEVVFELALCADCMEEATRGFSEESLARIREHFTSRYRPSEDLSICHLCRKPRGEGTDHEIAAVCVGDRLFRPPVVVCTRCAAAAQENLSDRTRRAWDEFLDGTLPGVPREMEPDRIPLTF